MQNTENSLDAGQVDGLWTEMRGELQKGRGRDVRDALNNIRRDNRRVFNALYWRCDEWMASYMSRAPLTPMEAKAGLTDRTVGQERLSSFLWGLGDKKLPVAPWQPDDLAGRDLPGRGL